jgi:hypothetical protein
MLLPDQVMDSCPAHIKLAGNILNRNNILSNLQFGCKKSKSTKDAIVPITDNVIEDLNNKIISNGFFGIYQKLLTVMVKVKLSLCFN